MNDKTKIKQRVAEAASHEILQLRKDIVLGVGTGSTIDCLIDMLSGELPYKIVSSSKRTSEKLASKGIKTVDFNRVDCIDVYIDGADQILNSGESIKGMGGAHALEKILAYSAKTFIGIISDDKFVESLSVPIPVETLPEARSSVARALVRLGGIPNLRESMLSDRGFPIIDVYYKSIDALQELEDQIVQIPGVLESGLFGRRVFDKIFVGNQSSVEIVDLNEKN